MSEFLVLFGKVLEARTPEEIFGKLDGSIVDQLAKGKKVFKSLAKILHPDHQSKSSKEKAEEAFKVLSSRWKEAQDRIKRGVYGDNRVPLFSIKTKERTYTANTSAAIGDISELYYANDREVLLKVVRDPKDNDLMETEVRILNLLHNKPKSDALDTRFPKVLDSLLVHNRRITVFDVYNSPQSLYSIEEIVKAYPEGIDPRDMVWMWKRALGIAGYFHRYEIVHGALTPGHILYDIDDHSVYIVGWTCAVSIITDQRVKAIATKYKLFYPQEILKKKVVDESTDIFMIAKCMIHLLGLERRNVPNISTPLMKLLNGCIMENKEWRLDNTLWIHKEIDRLLISLFGPRKFRHFIMPS